jgi:hypothetical protein
MGVFRSDPRVPRLAAIVALALAADGARTRAQEPRGSAQRRAIVPAAAPAAAPAPPSPRNASYSIDATLDPATHTLTGREVVTWRNTTQQPTRELRLHLYWNAWRRSDSTWLREGALLGGNLPRPSPDWASIDVTAVRLLGVGASPPIDLTTALRFIAPDDGNAADRTLAAVALPQPLGAGETVNVAIDWRSRVPRTFARTGRIGQYYFLAHWFPKMAVLEPGGWVSHQFHAATEFYADYGTYDVRITVPDGWTVGATGRQHSRESRGGQTTHRYVEDDVHDFAWVTSPDLVEHRARFEHPTLPPVTMRLLLQPEHAGQEARHFEATRAALRYYGEWYGPYPYGHITIVDPAWRSGSGGMEYPTLFTAGTRWLARPGTADPEAVTVHEAGHQFWYGLVANNEFEHAWLDEGLDSFSTSRVLAERFAPIFAGERFFGGFIPWVHRGLPLTRATIDGLGSYRQAAESDPQSHPSWRYFPATSGAITYSKTALWLHTLERMLGWPTLQRVLATFFERYRYRHPTPDDFFAVANEVSGRDLTPFFDEVHRSSNAFDYGIASLSSEPAAPAGLDDRGRAIAAPDDQAASRPYDTTVIVRRYGEAVFPIDVLVVFENGERVRERWDGRERWQAFRYRKASRALSAEADPDRVLRLDVNLTNNGRTLAPENRRAAAVWSAPWLVWLQDRVLTFGFVF